MANAINIVATFNGKQAFDGLAKLEKSFGVLKKAMIAVFASKMVKEAAQFGKSVSIMADKTGMSITKLESLRNTFISAGAGAKGFEQTINHINKGLLGLNRGEGQFAAALAPMGISPFGTDARGVLLEIADWAKTQKDLGRSEAEIMDYLESRLGIAPEYAKTLMGGRDYVLSEEARLANKIGTPNEQSIKNLAELNRSLAELGRAWDNAKTTALGQLAPILTALFDGIGHVLGVFTQFPELGAAALAAASSIGILKSAMLGFSLLSGGASLAGGASSIAGGAVLGLGKGLLAGTFLTIIIDSIWECVDMLKTGEINGPIGKLWESLFNVIGDGWDWVKEKFAQIEDWRLNNWKNQYIGSMSYKDFAKDWIAGPDLPVVTDDDGLLMSLKPGDFGEAEKPVFPTSIEVHMEGSTFTGVENAEDVGTIVGNNMTSMVPAA